MGVTRRVTGKREQLDVGGDARFIADRMLALIRARVANGLDISDRPFAGYDADYRERAGSKVDLGAGATGGLLATLVATVTLTPTGATITVRPSPAHMKVGSYLHRGTPHMPARPWLGLSPRDLVVLNRDLAARRKL